jgi:hypothetical protein
VGAPVRENAAVIVAEAVNRRELHRYAQRIGDRWPLERAIVAGARIDDEHGVGLQRERGAEFVVVLVSEFFAGVPWLERVYQAGSLWDAAEMGDGAEVHCYTPDEFARKVQTLPAVRHAADCGIEVIP